MFEILARIWISALGAVLIGLTVAAACGLILLMVDFLICLPRWESERAKILRRVRENSRTVEIELNRSTSEEPRKWVANEDGELEANVNAIWNGPPANADGLSAKMQIVDDPQGEEVDRNHRFVSINEAADRMDVSWRALRVWEDEAVWWPDDGYTIERGYNVPLIEKAITQTPTPMKKTDREIDWNNPNPKPTEIELNAMQKCAELLDQLGPDVHHRVVFWLAHRCEQVTHDQATERMAELVNECGP